MRRKTILTAAAALLFVFARSPQERTITDPATVPSPRNADARPVPIDDLFFSRNITDPAWSPDGKNLVFSTNLTGRLNLWKVPASGGWPVQLAVSDDRQSGASWSPDGRSIVWQQDHGGNEAYDIYLTPAGGGAAQNITATPDISETDPMFSPDSKSLAVAWKPVKSPTIDIAVIDLATKSVRNLTNENAADHSWVPVAWSHDGKWLVDDRLNADFTAGEIYTIDAATGKATNLTPGSKVRITASSLSPGDRTLLVTSNEPGGYDNVALLDIASKRLTWLTDV